MLKAIWQYRGFVSGSVKREFQSKYSNSLLGATWNAINPLAMIVIYTMIFSQVMRTKLAGSDSTFAYSIFLCSGILTWNLFTEIVTRAQNTFIENANLLKKLSFPRLALPMIVIANALINFFIVFSIFTIFLLFTGNFPGLVYIALAPVLAILVFFSIGLGITLGVLNVFFRDVGQFLGIILQFWFWFTPIVYTQNLLSENILELLNYNPMTSIVITCQNILVKHEWPQWHTLWPVTLEAIALCTLGFWLFKRRAGEIVDEL